MNALSVNNISKSVKDENLFSNVSFGLEIGEKLGIIGKNGAGKSTFLKILGKELEPDDGELTINNNCTIGFLQQDVSFPKNCTLDSFLFLSKDPHIQLLKAYEEGDHSKMEEVESLGLWDLRDRYHRYLYEMGVKEDSSMLMENLSGGTQKKAAIARLLAPKPSILLLDEPTNHLDIPAIEWLEDNLKGNFTVILITHDRYFLDAICNKIMEIDRHQAYFYEGGYTDFLTKREERISALQKEQDRLATILRRELEWLHRGPKARTGKDSGRKQRIEEMQSQQTRVEEEGRDFSSTARRMGKKILELKNISIARNGKSILKDFSFEFVKGMRFGVIGENGSGKSTLLETMTGNLAPDSGIVDTGLNTVFGYYDQRSSLLPLKKTPLEFFNEIGQNIVLSQDYSVTPARFLELFGFPSSFHRLPIEVLSGGEKRRLYLLSKLVRNPNFLVLDEPTNDLDIETLRKLESYILDFSGCVMIVSHDRAFLDRTCNELIIMPQGKRFEGNYTQWHEAMKKSQVKSLKEDIKAETSKPKERTKKGPTFKEKQELAIIEKNIEELEKEKNQLEDFFSSGQVDS
ncbi:MAG: ABC-F family ATP-binding cassette domain-containing protein, partial [Sphaerochaetaceae bacterium]|nr:ABC-F family ATP-binding cassette domain-containing protein [Sphaerochaetaceae bacterium]